MLKPIFGLELIQFPIYGIMLVLGYFIGLIMLNSQLGKAGYSPFMKKVTRRSFFRSAVAGLLCANIANWFLFEGALDLSVYTRLTRGGFSFLFGMLPFLGLSALQLRLYKVPVKKTMNLVVGPLLIAHFVGRLGCSLRGCCWGQTVMLGDFALMLPIREVEAVALLVMGIVIPKKSKAKTLWVYLFSYSLLRFILEFFRGDDRGTLLGITALSPSQLLCIVLFVVSGVALFLRLIMRACHAEDKLDMLKEKLRIHRKDGSVYEPRPVEYVPPKKKHPVRLILRIVALVLVAALLFVYFNPLQTGWCYNLQQKLDDLLSVFTTGRSTQQVIGDSNGMDMLPVSYDGPVDLESGAALVAASDAWAGAEFIALGEKALNSGGKMYTYCQTVNGKPVLGATRVLLTDANSVPQYLLSDAAGLSFTKDELPSYATSGKTLKELLGRNVKIEASLACWYDTGKGLLAVEHVLFRVGDGPLLGAVLQAADQTVICLTQAELGVFSTADRGDLLQDMQEALQRLQAEAAPATMKNSGMPSVVLLANRTENVFSDAETMVEQVLEMLWKRFETLDTYQKIAIICSVRDVLSVSPTANPKLFCQVLVQQTEIVLTNMSFPQEEITQIIAYMQAYMEQFYPVQEDEAAIRIDAQEKEKTFTYGMQYSQDADIYRVVSQPEHSLSVTITTDVPVQVEVYDIDGRAVTSIFVEKAETFVTYPEDGTEFTVRVKVPNLGVKIWPATYRISVHTEKQTVEVPTAIRTAIYRVESAYNTSNAVAFASMYKYQDQSITENMGLAMFLPVMDTCAGILTQNDQVDYAKMVILEAMLRQNMETQDAERLKDTQMTVSYVRHIERDDGYLVKVNIRVTREALLIVNSYCLFRLQPMKDGELPVEIAEVQNLMGLLSADYYITESNTQTLLQEFGETWESLFVSSDLTSLYRLSVEDEIIIDESLSLPQIRFEKENALNMGHSYNKAAAFEVYVTRQNLSTLKQAYMQAKYLATMYRSVVNIYDVIDILSDPVAVLVDGLDSEFASKAYETYGYFTDPYGSVKDALVDEMMEPLISSYREKAEIMERRCEILQEKINDCELVIAS